MSQGVFTALPLKHQEWKWNGWENPASAQAGREGIIVLIVLILCPTPPSPSNSTHHSTHPLSFCFCVVLLVRGHHSPSLSSFDSMHTLWISRTFGLCHNWRFSSSKENQNEMEVWEIPREDVHSDVMSWREKSPLPLPTPNPNSVALLNSVRIQNNWSVYLSFSCLCLLCTILSLLGNIALCLKMIILKCSID